MTTSVAPFVDVGWLAEHRAEVVVADVRFHLDGRSGGAAFEAGRIPGAVYVSLEEVLSAPAGDARGGRHPLPSPSAFAAGLAAAGIGDGAVVVGCDDQGGVVAARLVWLLRAVGVAAALLDGGVQAWPSGELERGPGTLTAGAAFAPRPWPAAALASIEDAASPGAAVLIDGRDGARFGGGPDPVDPRSGHVPGARNVPARDLLDPDGRLVARAELRERFAAAGVAAGTPVISYCGSGVTACFNLLALEHAGLGAGRLWPGSWSEWSRDPRRPLET